jgi:hypothetical protein
VIWKLSMWFRGIRLICVGLFHLQARSN